VGSDMKAQTFEIKVAFLGNVGAGKTTLINALLRDKYSEVAIGRTTVGITFFRVFTKPDQLQSEDDATEASERIVVAEDDFVISIEKNHNDEMTMSMKSATTRDKMDESMWSIGPENFHSVEQTYATISKANLTSRA
jgi:GTPase SAR1 family protein